MYKFTNGIVVFDKETRDRYIAAGMSLVKEKEDKNAKSENDNIKSERFEKGEAEVGQQSMVGRNQEVNAKNGKKKL